MSTVRPRQKLLLAISLGVTALLTFGGIVMYAYDIFDEKIDVVIPYRDFIATEAKMNRGRYLFLLGCAWCHLDRNDRLGSHQILAAPAWVGSIFVPNLSRDPLYGISAYSDGEIWLQMRRNLTNDHRVQPLPVPGTRLSDEDLESLIVYLRNDEDIAAPVSQPSQPSRYSAMGKLVSALFVAGRDQRRNSINVFAAGSRGQYLADAVLKCMNCHSPGLFQLNSHKTYAGSQRKIPSGSGILIRAPALRGTDSLLRWYTVQSLGRLLRYGHTPDKRLVEMPLEPNITDSDVSELWRFFTDLETNSQYKPGSLADDHLPATRLTRNIDNTDCDACHQSDIPSGTPAFAAAHATPAGQKSLYFGLRAATFTPSEDW